MNPNDIKIINVHELKTRMDLHPDLCLIDVREPQEWSSLRIPGAAHIPKDEIILHIGTVITDKAQPVYLHCQSGIRSLYAAKHLMNEGYTNVYSIEGGILEWTNSGYPTER